ncbi:MAG: DUF748 domain-containing protein [Desulfuromonadaceae bacterium]|nr:DUF748 domain-containing protein [Desulfuromonadaceae bacterium]
MKKRNAVLIIVAIIFTLGIVGRMCLPFWLKGYVNKTLNDIDGYRGSVADIEVNLYRGAYIIKGVFIEKMQGEQIVPFISFASMDLSLQWKALLQGALVAEVGLDKAKIHFVGADKESDKQTGVGVDWTKPLKKLLPISINHFTIRDGTVFYHDFESDPQVNISLTQLQLVITNISNVEDADKELPSTLHASAISVGNGVLTVSSRMNLLQKIPDVDLDLKFEKVHLPALNDFLKAYVNVDAETGTFFLYAEITVKDGQLNGYVKPIFTNVSLVDLSDSKSNVLKDIWEMIVGTVVEIFENQPKDQLATKIPLEGDLSAPEVVFLPTLWNIFRNAFVQAFSKNTDGTVKFSRQENFTE